MYNGGMETLIEEELEAVGPRDAEEKSARDSQEKDPTRLQQRKPPGRGLCRRCGRDRPINRLMLCYPCWVKTELEDKAGWREGMPHPDWCRCQGLSDHTPRSFGN